MLLALDSFPTDVLRPRWANWIRDKRIEQPAGLVVLGSDNVALGQSDRNQCSKIAVIFESGLDNSPMCESTHDSFDDIVGVLTVA